MALCAAMHWDIPFMDTIAAIISSLVIIKWSIGLLKDSGLVLLDIETEHKGHSHGYRHHH